MTNATATTEQSWEEFEAETDSLNPYSAVSWSPQQQEIIDWSKSGTGNAVVIARAGCGKCLGIDTPVLTYDGRIIPVQDVKPGDLLMGPDSKPRRVLVSNTGSSLLYKIIPTKGDSFVCNDDHILVLTGTNREKGKEIEISVKDFIKNGWSLKNWKLFRTGVDFSCPETPVYDPYLVGLWIGDGTQGSASITNSDPEVIEYLGKIAPMYGQSAFVSPDKRSNAKTIRMTVAEGKGSGRNASNFLKYFRSLSKNKEKSIPENLLTSSRENRMSLLAGILDTDGNLSGPSGYEVTTKWIDLANQILFLARSLGFAAYLKKKTGSIKSLGFSATYFRVHISGNCHEIPCLVEKRKAKKREQIKRHNVTGFTIEPIGNGDYYGFTLDGDGRFLLGDFTVTHNTFTLCYAASQAPESKIFQCSYGAEISEELKKKILVGEASTLHSAGLKQIRKVIPSVKIDKNVEFDRINAAIVRFNAAAKTLGFSSAAIEFATDRKQNSLLIEIVSWLKNTAPHTTDLKSIHKIITEISFSNSFSWDWEKVRTDSLPADQLQVIYAMLARSSILATIAEAKSLPKSIAISYDDMLWMPVATEKIFPLYDLIYADEVQDFNSCMLDLLQGLLLPSGRMCLIGDPMQSLYAFRGADPNAIPRMVEKLSAQIFTLNVTRRCPVSVVEMAKSIVPDFTAADDAIDGLVDYVGYENMMKDANPGDFILSRTNAKLVRVCMRLLGQKRRAYIVGKEIGVSLLKIIQKIEGKKPFLSVGEMISRISAWGQKSLKTLENKKMSQKDRTNAEADITDQVEVFVALSEGFDSVDDIYANIRKIFANPESSKSEFIALSTCHRAKGLESDTVWILEDSFTRPKSDEEDRIRYVAITRAKKQLFLVEKELYESEDY